MDSNSSNITTMSKELMHYMTYYNKTRDFLHPTMGITLTIICIIGMLANILNIIALSMIIKKSKLPVYRCFLGLAIADFMVVFFMSIKAGCQYLDKSKMVIDNYDIGRATQNRAFNYVYYLMPHFTNVAFAASNWCVVTMSSLRCIAVFTPLWYQRHCTTRVVNTILLLVYLVSVIVNIPSFLVTRYDPKTKLFSDVDNMKFNPKVVSLLVIQVCPMLITTVLVIILICKLCSRPAIERSASNAEYRSRDRLQTSVTLVCISAFFVFCITPSVVYFANQYFSNDKKIGPVKMYERYKTYAIVQLFLVLSYTANFCFYVLLNARLRRKLKHILGCSKDRGMSSEIGPDHNSSVGWSPASVLNANRRKKSIDRNGKRMPRRTLSTTSTCTQRSTVSFSPKVTHSRGSVTCNKKTQKPTERNSLFNIDEKSESDCLIQSNSRLTESSTRQASTCSLNTLGVGEKININNNAEDVTDMTEDISIACEEMNTDIKPSISLYSDLILFSADAVAPIATLDTMNDLESACELQSLL